jgi:hypothetical protein
MFAGKTEAHTGTAKVLIPAKSYICSKAYTVECKSVTLRAKHTLAFFTVVLFAGKTEAYVDTVEASIPPKANVCEQC